MYNFTTLNDKDLELLTLDLLNAEYNLKLQSFKVGKDKGVDLRYSSPQNNNSIVVQVKHYLKSGFKQLLRDLKNKELDKVKLIKPSRYIIVTSIELSAIEKDQIKELFDPYIIDSNDVLGGNDLNDLLRNHDKVETQHFKLWFSSAEVLRKIINNGIEGRSRNKLELITRKIGLYVLTNSLDKANEILEKEKLLLITGQPGIGKTTLAHVLLNEKARDDYQIYFISNIKEAESVISDNNEIKQVFYFDDFLGEVYYEIITGSQNESEISSFVDRIKHTPNKYIILSTRTVILEQAKQKSEKIKRSKLETGKYELALTEYSNLEKAQILYNHIYFQDVSDMMIDAIFEDEFYNSIIYHQNYTPRIVEFLTDKIRFGDLDKNEYRKAITQNLLYPEEIWRSSFENQISYFDQCLLYTLFSFQRNIEESVLEKAFNNRLLYERQVNNKETRTDQFKLSIKTLLNGFITSSIINVDKKTTAFNFINPSLSDFILQELKSHESLRNGMLNSMIYIEQFQFFDPRKQHFQLETESKKNVLELIKNDKLLSLHYLFDDERRVNMLNILINFIDEYDVDEIMLQYLEKLELRLFISFYEKGLCEFLLNIRNCPKSFDFIKLQIGFFLNAIYTNTNSDFVAKQLPNILMKYGYKITELSSIKDLNIDLDEFIPKILRHKENELFESHKGEINTAEDLETFIHSEIQNLRNDLSQSYDYKLVSYEYELEIDNEEIQKQISQNELDLIESERRQQERKIFNELQVANINSEKRIIKDLFYR